MFNINLPNPYEMSIPEFFIQMRIVLKAAEKSYEAIAKGKNEDELAGVFISYRLGNLMEAKLEKAGIDTIDEDLQKMALEINAS